MADAQIPGVFAQSAQSKVNYPETFGHEYAENSPLMIAHRKEMEEILAAHKKEMDELRAMITAGSKKREHKSWTPEQIEAARQRGINLANKAKAAREAKAAAAQD
jgi:ABC-type Fe3+-citrate transport system substrate-binding protein